MNPVIERQLARLRTRLAKTPLPGFFSWWGHQLVACLPARARALIEERPESLLLDLHDDEMIVWREGSEGVREYGRIPRNLPVEAQAAEFQRLRGAIDDPGVRTILCIPASRVLERSLSLPAAAEDNLRQVLAFEMDRQTPFKSDQVYFDSRVLGRDASGRNLHVELVLLPRAQLDHEIGSLPPGASALDAVDSWRSTPGSERRHINLLPAERRARRRNMRLPLNLGLAALALILLFVNMDESLTNRAAAVEAMRAEVDKSDQDAKQVAALRKTLADSIAGANFLTDKKRNSPLTIALLDDLTRRLPEDTYLERLQIENGQVQLQGQAKEAAKLIALLGSADCISNPKLQGQIQPDPRTGKERFQINADVKPCSGAEHGASPAATKPATAKADPAKGMAKDAAAKDVAAKGAAVNGAAAKNASAKEAAAKALEARKAAARNAAAKNAERKEQIEKAQAERKAAAEKAAGKAPGKPAPAARKPATTAAPVKNGSLLRQPAPAEKKKEPADGSR